MLFNSLTKNETRLTTTDELIAAMEANEKYFNGIHFFKTDLSESKVLYVYGSQYCIVTKHPDAISLKFNTYSKNFLTINKSNVTMSGIGNQVVEIPLDSIDSIEFFQYECLGVDFGTVSTESMRTLINLLKGKVHAFN